MMKIKAKINFDIVEQIEANVPLESLFSDLPPEEVIFNNGKTSRKATKKDKKAFFDYVANDPTLIPLAKEHFSEYTREEEAA